MYNKDMDGVIECLPHFIASSISAVKILNIHFNRRSFDKLFQLVAKQWQELKLNDELHILEETVMQGNRMAQFYHNTLVSFMGLFLLVPLIFPILDIVHPINGTRTRQQLLRVNYIFFNGSDYFFYIYVQLFCAAAVVVFTIISADWLYMLIIHHASGLFAVCGHRVQKATVNPNNSTGTVVSENYTYEKIRNCAIMHSEAILFYNILNGSSQGSYLIQVGLNMLGISVTAVQIVVNLDRPEEAMRSAVFCGASQFHLFLLSLPGQVLLDHCSDLADNIYSSTWYGTPVQIQKVLYVMQIRCKRFCSLTAGGLYEMNIENFGNTFKTCMSYITMLMSLKN
ncbi:odorant receptor Or2-like isoform X2 [Bombus flavifrons]|uniref:odorant receptor Or2-like isoform X2 n=1 Tax=Bombus flavifrons TaxID=103934 RepID=UPI003703FA93